MYIQFDYKDGSNPFISMNYKTLFHMVCKYVLEQTDTDKYTVHEKSQYLTVKHKKLTAYEKAKTALREFAWNFDYNFSRFTWYYDELAYMQGFFEEYGKRYGLYTEFHENAIC